MKNSVWDILTGITLLAILCAVATFVAVAVNPGVAFNPLPPPATIVPLVLPSATGAGPGLPPTWTPVPPAVQEQPAQFPTLRPSRTPEPTATRVVLPTFTPSKTVRVGSTGGGSGTGAGQGGGDCTIVYQNPADDTVLPRGSAFDTRWTVKNTSDESWRADSIDLRFQSGTRLHNGSDARDLQYEVGAGGAVDILISMTAPSNAGTYTSNWGLMSGSKAMCKFYVTIKVE
jgi:hypothetical protein